MKRKTTISLTIAALLSLSGMVYAANHVFFSFLVGTFSAGPIGVAASPDGLFVTQFCDPELLSLNCSGIPTPIATIPGFPTGQCLERYMAVAPLVSATAGFAPRDIFITQGNTIFKFTQPAGPVVPFTTLPACGDDHTGITFDHVGTFGNKMILSCENGTIWSVNGAGAPSLVATLPINIENEGPAVAPSPSFGPFGGQILVTNDNDAVNAIRNDGFVTLNAFFIGAGSGPESVQVIPDTLCTFCQGNGAYFQAVETGCCGSFPGLYEYFPIDFSGLGGDILVPCEGNDQTVRIHWNGSSYDMFFFDAIPGALLEGSNFVDCNIPSPTPTPTATATFTPTATATFTPTATATFTPTATATFTPTATATFTPTATATSTPTSTPTPTPTPTTTPTRISQITPTGTTCNQFRDHTAATLDHLNYSVSNGVIKNNVTPGVFFYWVSVTAPAGPNVFTITETITTGNFTCLFNFTSGSSVFNSNCGSVSNTITQNTTTGTVTVSFNAPVAGTYIIGIKYDSKSIAGCTAPNPPTVHYDFATTGVPGSTSGLDLIKN